MRIVALSDTHEFHRRLKIPDGDVLVHAGDMTNVGAVARLQDFDDWLATLPHPFKVVIAGNHDWGLSHLTHPKKYTFRNAIYLEDSETVIDGVRFYGSPWTNKFYDWAFMKTTEKELAERWEFIPERVDVLVTHGPPKYILDGVPEMLSVRHCGSESLRDRVLKIKPRLHIFGHIHEGAGTLSTATTTFHNVSTCDGSYHPINPIRVIDFQKMS